MKLEKNEHTMIFWKIIYLKNFKMLKFWWKFLNNKKFVKKFFFGISSKFIYSGICKCLDKDIKKVANFSYK